MNFKFSPDILTRLGEELISNPEYGIIELVKNSYDADAIECTVDLKETNELGGMVVISDDGTGMDLEAISNGWFLIGHSKKSSQVLTPLGRSPAGNKGLGRIAALRLGTHVILTTRPSNEPEWEYSLTINWKQFEDVDAVEAINFDILKRETTKKHGTQIIIHNLQVRLGREEIQRLARELILLADPFVETGFHPKLVAPEFVDLEQQVLNSYFDDAEFHLKAQLNEEGLANAWLLDWKGKVLSHTEHQKLSNRPYKTVPATFELWVFLLSYQSFSSRRASLSQVREWLAVVGGVKLYYRGLRVRPYGEPGYDWLDMNLARARSPEERPSTNTSVGMVFVNDSRGILLQKTDRMGFIESEAFLELKRFATDALNWMARERLQASERKRREEHEKAPRKSAAARKTIEQIVDVISEKDRPKVKQALQQYERAKEREAKMLREDLQLYRGMATVGITSAVFAHEAGKPVSRITRITKSIEQKGKELLDQNYTQLEKYIVMLYYSAETIKNYAMLPLHILSKNKRCSEVVDVHLVIDEIIKIFNPFLNETQIQISFEKADANPHVHGSISMLEVIVTNFLTNSINAFTKVEGAPIQNRKIVIRTEFARTNLFDHALLLRFLDNALGITNISPKEIWLPGRTTQSDGTGFGLTIVKDSVTDLGENVGVIPNGELGGAEFIVELPVVKGG